jgi:hypothetical protein
VFEEPTRVTEPTRVSEKPTRAPTLHPRAQAGSTDLHRGAFRTRLFAISALAATVSAAAIAIASSGGSAPARTSANTGGHRATVSTAALPGQSAHSPLTIDQQLEQLARGVRRAARP